MAQVVKHPPANAGDARDTCLILGLGRFPWSRKWQYTPVFLPVKLHEQRSLASYSPRCCKELNTTEHTHSNYSDVDAHTHTHTRTHVDAYVYHHHYSSHTCCIITALPTADFLDFSLFVWIYSQKNSKSYFTKNQIWLHSFLLTIPPWCPSLTEWNLNFSPAIFTDQFRSSSLTATSCCLSHSL